MHMYILYACRYVFAATAKAAATSAGTETATASATAPAHSDDQLIILLIMRCIELIASRRTWCWLACRLCSCWCFFCLCPCVVLVAVCMLYRMLNRMLIRMFCQHQTRDFVCAHGLRVINTYTRKYDRFAVCVCVRDLRSTRIERNIIAAIPAGNIVSYRFGFEFVAG